MPTCTNVFPFRNCCLLAAGSLLLAGTVWSQETTLTATNATVAFGSAASWDNGVPGTTAGINDNAAFTNNVKQTLTFATDVRNGGASFRQTLPGMTNILAMGASSWTLTNSLVLAANSGNVASLMVSNGMLAVTNGGTAQLLIGQAGPAAFVLSGTGTAVVDRIIATNSTWTTAFSFLGIGGGTLSTLGNSEIYLSSNSTFMVTGRWNVAGGAAFLHSWGGTGDLMIAANSALSIAGPSTVFTNAVSPSNLNSYVFQGVNAQLIVSNGAQMIFSGRAGSFLKTSPNSCRTVVTDPGSRLDAVSLSGSGGWRMSDGNKYNQLIVSNRAQASIYTLSIGFNAGSLNTGIVAAAGQLVTANDVVIGNVGNGAGGYGNVLLVMSSGQVSSANGYVGYAYGTSTAATNNMALVSDPGSTWRMSGALYIGNNSAAQYISGNALRIANSGTVSATAASIGNGTGSNCLITLDSGGVLWVTNGTAKATLKILHGALTNDGGTVTVDQLTATSIDGACVPRTGTFACRATTSSNGLPFVIGNGPARGVFQMLGGSHGFSNGVTIAANGALTGTGTVVGAVSIAAGGALSPADTNAMGTIAISGNLDLQNGGILETDVGASSTDRVTVSGTVTLPDSATIRAQLPAGYDPSHPAVILTATSLTGATDLSRWTVVGYSSLVPAIQNGTNLVIKTRPIRGTSILVR